MKQRNRPLLVSFLALFVSAPVHAQHGGGGGHAGGHFGGGNLSGHSVGHTVGHSLGHMFGHGSGRNNSRAGKVPGSRGEEPPLAGAAMMYGRVVLLPGPVGEFVPIRPPSGRVRPLFVAGAGLRTSFALSERLDSGFCAYAFTWHNFLFPGDGPCFGGDPFLFDRFSSSGFISGNNGTDFSVAARASRAEQSAVSRNGAESFSVSPVDAEEPAVLLELRDGSMYGLNRYWVEGDRLHYVTNYGGENSVALERIDLAKTAELNAGRGTALVLPAGVPRQ